MRDRLKLVLRMRTNGSARRDIEDAIAADEESGAAFSPEERNMLRAILRLGDLRVEDVMVPRADIDAADIQIPIAKLLTVFRDAGHSRMPVYRETLDDPIGMVHIKDIMKWILDTASGNAENTPESKATAEPENPDENAWATLDLSAVDLRTSLHDSGTARPVLFVPPSMPARILLERMQASRTQMALVIDEYGGTDGLVSLEDLVEIIVGEIEDEHDDAEEATIVKVGDGLYVADARAPIEDAIEIIGPSFDVGEYGEDTDTVGGMVFMAAGRIPVRGEIIHPIANFEFEILDADPRRIKRIRIRERRKIKVPIRSRTKDAPSEPANQAGQQPARPADDGDKARKRNAASG
ncbi:MAG TPA: hemolysin family protein [Afifellaceae bacterium]|nr:hemolysin family protein [Afifellaceae bacterium]